MHYNCNKIKFSNKSQFIIRILMNTLSNQPFWLDPKPVVFPPTHLALTEPDGLLAVGGDLTPEWLLTAYHNGIFPWFNEDDPILWWTPNPRSVLFLDKLKIRRSLIKVIRKQRFSVTLDHDFLSVITHCATTPRHGQDGTWISDAMMNAYYQLYQKGHAHSVEVWHDKKLVGGLYGVAIGKMFYGESMFAHETDASKIALIALSQQLQAWEFLIIDTQIETPHLKSLGAKLISREHFETLLHQQTQLAFPPKHWQMEIDWQAPFLPIESRHQK